MVYTKKWQAVKRASILECVYQKVLYSTKWMRQGRIYYTRSCATMLSGIDSHQNSHEPFLQKHHLEHPRTQPFHPFNRSYSLGGVLDAVHSPPHCRPSTLRFFTNDYSPLGPYISAENKMITVYHFDKFVKHAAIFGKEAAEKDAFVTVYKTISKMCLFSPIEACKTYPENQCHWNTFSP